MKLRLGKSFFTLTACHIWEFIFYYIGAILCLIGLNYFQSEVPLLAKNMGDLAAKNDLESLPLYYFFLVAMAILFFRTLSRLLFFYPARMQQKFLRNELLWRLSQTAPKKYKDYTSGQLYQTLYNDLNRIRAFMGFALLQAGNAILAIIIFIPKIIEVHSDLLYAYTPLLIGVIIFSIMITFFAPFDRRGTNEQGEVQHFIIESYQGFTTLKNFNGEGVFIKKFAKLSWRELHSFFMASLGRVISSPLIKLSLGASFLWGAYIVQEQSLGASTLIFFSGFLFLLFEPFMFLSWIGVVSTSAWASWKRISELLSCLENEPVKRFPLKENEIHYTSDLWGYKQTHTFKKGETYVVGGETGAGKTSFLEGLASSLASKKQDYSFVFQEPYLYNDTLLANLFLGKKPNEEDKKQAHRLLKAFALGELVEGESFWELELGENGKRISGGQAKRLVLVRSLLSQAKILLWDDPFSSVDMVLENSIFNFIEENSLLKDKILIFTAHRYSSIKRANYIGLVKKEEPIAKFEPSVIALKNEHKIYEYFKEQFI